MTFTRSAGLIAACSLALATVVACSDDRPAPRVVSGQGDERFPAESLTDLVSYADQVSEISVVSEEELPPQPGARKDAEGYVARAVTMNIGPPLWRRKEDAPTVSGPLRIPDQGWVTHDGRRQPFAVMQTTRLEVGRRYVVPLLRDARGQWMLVSATLALTLGPDGVARAAPSTGSPTGAARALSGMPLPQVTGVLNRTAPDPVAQRYANLDPDRRIKAVQAAKSD